MTLSEIYSFEKRLLRVCMAMTARGLRIDDAERKRRIAALEEREAPLQHAAARLVEPLRPKLKRPELMWKERTCKSCRNGSRKKLTCMDCKGAGKFESFDFNLGSTQQLCDVLYSGLKLPQRLRDNKITVDEEALQSLVTFDKSGLVKMALEYAKLDTMRAIYERLQPAPDGRVRTVFNPAGTMTGRLSSRGAFYVEGSTQLHNLPSFEAGRDPLYEVRGVVLPSPGYVFLDADLSQAEARITAAISGDDTLLRRWADSSWDVHKWTAAQMFGKPEEEISKTERYLGKVARHALNYGMGVTRFWRHVNASSDLTGVAISMAEARRIHAAYHALHPNLRAWWGEVERKLAAGAPIETCYGRRANFWPRTELGEADSDALQAAIAYEPQSTIADLCNLALCDLYDEENESYRVVHQVHDSVIVEARRAEVMQVAERMRRCMHRTLRVHGTEVEVPVEVKMCEANWGAKRRVL